jgi:hypothetical protein
MAWSPLAPRRIKHYTTLTYYSVLYKGVSMVQFLGPVHHIWLVVAALRSPA